jgi:exosortase A-associated hydrolase 1
VSYDEVPFFFACGDDSLLGIVALPAVPAEVGVLVIVGGPQYRVGSHRQFVLLARALASAGIACMRFDHRGVGDSSGDMRSFEAIGEDIRAAVDAFLARAPRLTKVVLWGLCDAASAACFYAASDSRVAGMVLLNPWVRTDASEASTYLRHYYFRRLLEPAFWRKVVRGEFAVSRSARSLGALIRRASQGPANEGLPLPDRMANALAQFRGRVLLVLSGKDLTAAEFRDTAARSGAWAEALQANPPTTVELPDADHTFSTGALRRDVAEATRSWMQKSFTE